MSAAADDNGGAPTKTVDACNYLEGQLLINPNKILLMRIFYLDPRKPNISLWGSAHLETINPWWRSAVLNRLPSSSRINT